MAKDKKAEVKKFPASKEQPKPAEQAGKPETIKIAYFSFELLQQITTILQELPAKNVFGILKRIEQEVKVVEHPIEKPSAPEKKN